MGFLVDEYGGEELHTRAMLYDVHVNLGDRSYPIQIGSDIQSELGSFILNAGLSETRNASFSSSA